MHESYLKVFDNSEVQFADRTHFFAVVSQTMRRILVDHARARAAARRSSGGQRIPWDTNLEIGAGAGKQEVAILDLDLALDALAREEEFPGSAH